jgi:hypothetical protein
MADLTSVLGAVCLHVEGQASVFDPSGSHFATICMGKSHLSDTHFS